MEGQMKNSESEIESLIRKNVERAIQEFIKHLEAEPKEIIIEGEDAYDISEQTVADITSWLFKRRGDDDSAGH
jgi:hypothetical protein